MKAELSKKPARKEPICEELRDQVLKVTSTLKLVSICEEKLYFSMGVMYLYI